MNRGRIQAQGGRTEKSEAWTKEKDIDKKEGLSITKRLEQQLSKRELSMRKEALKQLKSRIKTSPSSGIDAPLIKTYYDDKRKRDIRIDLEIITGRAFIDEEKEK